MSNKLTEILLKLPANQRPSADSTPILAVSGGKDSMLLLHLFWQLYHQGYLVKPVVFHLNHGLRQEASQDLEFVRQQCQSLDIPFYYEYRNLETYAKRIKMGLEEAGRLLRYRFLAKLVKKYSNSYGVTAHHADDYIESLLIHLIRGGGPKSLETLPYWSRIGNAQGIQVLRPLMHLSTADIKKLLNQHHIPFREDPSNQSDQFLRNRLRNNLIPQLKTEGLDPVKLWQNFHEQSQSPVPILQKINSLKQAEYLSLERRFFSGSLYLKPLFDVCFACLGLPPATRTFLSEISKQVQNRENFKISYQSKQIYLWSDERGPVWIFHKSKAAVFRRFCYQQLEAGTYQIQYNHIKRTIVVHENESLTHFQNGMKISLGQKTKQGTKKVKKIFQEAGIPPPIRENLPLLYNKQSQKVSQILFSFWENKSDRSFFSG